jgi:hypothetical protein
MMSGASPSLDAGFFTDWCTAAVSAGVDAPVPEPEPYSSSPPGLNETRSFDFVFGAFDWGRRTTGPVSIEVPSVGIVHTVRNNVRKSATEKRKRVG